MNDQNLGTEEREPEILAAYRNLSTPTSPPDDLLVRVERDIRRRRTARRSVIGAAVLVLGGTVGMQVLGGDDGSDGTTATDQPGSETSSLTFTDTDGSTYTWAAEDIGVTCTTLTSEGGKDVEALVLARNDAIAAIEGDEFPFDDPEMPVLHVQVYVNEVEPGEELELPFDVEGGSESRPFTFFFTAEERGQGKRANELSSAEEGSSGTVTINEASCGPNPTLSLDIAGTLGSEVEQPALAIEGSYRS